MPKRRSPTGPSRSGLLTLLLAAALCADAGRAEPDTATLVAAVSVANLETHVRALSLQPRFTEAELAAAEAYVTATLESYGYTVTREPVTSVFNDEGVFVGGAPAGGVPAGLVAGRRSANLVAERVGTISPAEIFVVGAHFDTVPGSPGADDNATGVAAMLEIARVLASEPVAKTVRFVAFTFEESGFEGSTVHAQAAAAAGETIIGMTSLEMIGYTCDTPGCQFEFPDIPGCLDIDPDGVDVGTGIAATVNAASAPLLNALVQAQTEFVPDLEVFSGTVEGSGSCFPNIRRSDQVPFWDQGYTAFVLTDTANFRNPNYHLATDVADTVDFPFVAQVTRAELATVLSLVNPGPRVVFRGVEVPAFVDRAFGADGQWNTADDYTVSGANPAGTASGFRAFDNGIVGPPPAAYFGFFTDSELAVAGPLQLGRNPVVSGSAGLTVTLLVDETTQTPGDPPQVGLLAGLLEMDPSQPASLDLNPDNTFGGTRPYRVVGTPDATPTVESIGSWYLVKGQASAEVFADRPEVAAFFDQVVPALPADWTLVLLDRFVTADIGAPQFTYDDISALYSTDPLAIPAGLADGTRQNVPLPLAASLVLALLLTAGAVTRGR